MLSIIIPYYKLTFFEATLQSLANQTDKRFKVYIGDDASPEDPSNLLEKYRGKFDFLYHRFESNLGSRSLTKQWERCISMSKEEKWIMILGDDDILQNTVVDRFYKNYDVFNTPCNIVRFATQVLNEIKNETSEIMTNPLFESGIEYISRKITGSARGSLSEFVFKREVYLKHSFTSYPSAFYSDDRIILDLSEKKLIFSINDALVYIRISTESLSGKAAQVKDNLFLARYHFFKYLFNAKYSMFSTSIKKNLVEALLNNVFHYEKYNLRLILKIYGRSVFFADISFFLKINKRIIKLLLGKSNY